MSWLILDWKGRMVAQFDAPSVRDALTRFRAGGYDRSPHGSFHLIVKPNDHQISNDQGVTHA